MDEQIEIVEDEIQEDSIQDVKIDTIQKRKSKSSKFRYAFGWLGLSLLTVVLLVVGEMVASPIGIIFSDTDGSGLMDMSVTASLYLMSIGTWIAFILAIVIPKSRRWMIEKLWTKASGNNVRFLIVGLLLGFGMNSICALLAYLNKDIAIYYDRFNIAYVLIIFLCVFIQSSSEELACRIYLYHGLNSLYGRPIVAVLINSLLFGALHLMNPGITVLSVYNIVIIGIMFSLIIYYWDSFWCVAMIHTAWNFTQNILYGLPNSGVVVPYSIFKLDAGAAKDSIFYSVSFGIEGTLSADIVITIVTVLIFFIGRKTTGKKIERGKI